MEEDKSIQFTGKISLDDPGARIWLSKLQTEVDRINERTKQHTRDIQELRRLVKDGKQ